MSVMMQQRDIQISLFSMLSHPCARVPGRANRVAMVLVVYP